MKYLWWRHDCADWSLTLIKSAVTMASSVCVPGNHRALMIKFPVASVGCRTRWSATDPELVKVNTWQSCNKVWPLLKDHLDHLRGDCKRVLYLTHFITLSFLPLILDCWNKYPCMQNTQFKLWLNDENGSVRLPQYSSQPFPVPVYVKTL